MVGAAGVSALTCSPALLGSAAPCKASARTGRGGENRNPLPPQRLTRTMSQENPGMTLRIIRRALLTRSS